MIARSFKLKMTPVLKKQHHPYGQAYDCGHCVTVSQTQFPFRPEFYMNPPTVISRK